MLDVTDKDLFSKVAHSVLDSIGDALTACSLDVPDCAFVGFERPPEVSCPDLVAWVTNVRPWDGNTLDSGLREGRLLCFNAYAFDITIRLGLCYVDFNEDGSNKSPQEQHDLSDQVYRYAHVMYVGWVSRWKAGLVTELGRCDPLSLSPLISFKEGGCGGWEFTVSVGFM